MFKKFFKPRLTEESVVRFYLNHGLTIDYGEVRPINWGNTHYYEQDVRNATANVIRAINSERDLPFTSPGQALEIVLWKAKRYLANKALVAEVTEKVLSEKVESTRSRLMVRAVREGLDRTKEFYRILDATSLGGAGKSGAEDVLSGHSSMRTRNPSR